MHRFITLLAALLWSFSASAQTLPPVKVVYHLNEGVEQARNGLRNINNHLSADPKAKIVIVSHAAGVNFLIDGAKDKNGNPFDADIEALAAKGIEFRVCNFTLTSRNIDPKSLNSVIKIVPSGVAEISRLQAHEAFAYLKP